MNKTAIKNFAIWARRKLIADMSYRAGLMGITEDGIKEPLPQSTGTTEFYHIGTAKPYSISGEKVKQRKRLVEVIRQKEADTDYKTAYQYIIEEVAYTWFNRLIAVRFMEVNEYLPSRIRVLSSETGKAEPDLVTTPFDADLPFTEEERAKIYALKDKADKEASDELFSMLFIKQCNALNEILPNLFEETRDYTELLLNLSVIDKDGVVYHLVHDIDEKDFNVAEEGQVEIIGWLYQYYNTEPKDETFALLKKNVKITKERIPSATQLFTPDWIVRYMVENSLGRLWVEGHPDEKLKASWKYYLEEAEQEPEIQAQLEEIRSGYRKLNPEDIKVIDPCMGSGHILVYCFDVLMQIYEAQGYSQRDAALSILKHNLYGLDIDDRAAQLSYFAVMMKARQYDRRIFGRKVRAQVYAIRESNGVNRRQLQYFGASMEETQRNTALDEMNELLDTLIDAKEYGSILNVGNYHWDSLRQFVEDVDVEGQISLDSIGLDDTQRKLLQLVDIGQTMAQKYDVVVTNPPYMGASNMNPKLSDFIKKNYQDYKSDFFSAFVIRCSQMTKSTGKLGFFTPYVWMFIQSYGKMRQFLYSRTIETLIQFEYSAFEEATVPVCTFVFSNNYINKKGCYLRLTEFRGGMEVQRQKTLEAIADHNCGYYYERSADNFSKIPGSPVAYWASDEVRKSYERKNLDNLAQPRHGLATSDNDRFLKLWHEVDVDKTSTSIRCDLSKKWFPMSKGGSFRKWYGNLEWVINYEENGKEIKEYAISIYRCSSRTIQNTQFYFKEGLTWSALTSGGFSVRWQEAGALFGSGGYCAFSDDGIRMYILGLMNSKVTGAFIQFVSPTLNYEVGHIKTIPVKIADNKHNTVDNLVSDCIDLSKKDWDSYETSWDFKRHPIIKRASVWWDCGVYLDMENPDLEEKSPVQMSYNIWKEDCNERFAQLKANEEELNRIFIDIYGLQDELTPEVADKDVTVHYVVDNKEDVPESLKDSKYLRTKRDEVVSLISYAVGCMFGRYSLDVDGLAYAGGEWDASKYTTFLPDQDNVIPITDEEYFEDDIVGLFCAWLKKVYGSETLEANLDFIASALGNKGSTSREIIRNYFLKDFFKDHCKTYQKRPIYWLFDSGKQNGFKAIIYLHRYTEDTIGNLRIDYLHRMQRIYESEMNRMQDMIDNSTNSREVGAATKRKEKLAKQLKECRDYDEKIGHRALSRIELDLDDGVKVNYEKVQTATDGKKYQVLAKI